MVVCNDASSTQEELGMTVSVSGSYLLKINLLCILILSTGITTSHSQKQRCRMSCTRQLCTRVPIYHSLGYRKEKSQQGGKKHGKCDVKGFTKMLYSSLQNEISSYLTLKC